MEDFHMNEPPEAAPSAPPDNFIDLIERALREAKLSAEDCREPPLTPAEIDTLRRGCPHTPAWKQGVREAAEKWAAAAKERAAKPGTTVSVWEELQSKAVEARAVFERALEGEG